jgi:Neurotransmitter-gated ion-channel ligand binding domain
MVALFLASVFMDVIGASLALSVSSVEDLEGRIDPAGANFYKISNLQEGDTIYLYGRGTSGNFDPFVALGNSSVSASVLGADFEAEVNRTIEEGRDPLEAIPATAKKYFLAWDDDGGKGYDAEFKFKVPASDDYQLFVSSSPMRRTFGTYLLQLGINAPQVLTGQAKENTKGIAVLDKNLSEIGHAIQELNGTLTADKTSTIYDINPVSESDTIYAFIENIQGDLRPILILADYGNKTLRTGNWAGLEKNATLQYTFRDSSKNNRIIVGSGKSNENATSGSYRLLLGINAPEVLGGEANISGQCVVAEPIKVKAGVELDQITAVNQMEQDFDVVANIWMKWNDPELAFSPQECNCSLKVYRSINPFIQEYGSTFPEFTISNQQGNRWTQNQIIAVNPDGSATYFERFWVKLQAPDFDFRRYPLDMQDFYMRIDSLYPEENYFYENWPEKTEIGKQLGEEEWYITASDTNISSTSIQGINSRFSFHFQAKRHLLYYAFRIFLPIFIIVLISWVTLFLKDYGKRGDIAGANLLLFIAFNFTIGSDLPKIGYLTLLDWMLFLTFVLTALIFIYNLSLKLLEMRNKRDLAERIDRTMVWLYPLLYLCALFIAPLIVYINL